MLDVASPPETLFGFVADLSVYPTWLAMVHRAEPLGPGPLHLGLDVTPDAGETPPAWSVDLRGRLGPMARSKRLRMVRSVYDPSTRVRFERREVDGRSHAPWVLDAVVEGLPDGARLTVHLHYGGTFGGALLRRMLVDEIERARPVLADLVVAGST